MKNSVLGIAMSMSMFLVIYSGMLLYMPSEIVTGIDPVDYQIQNTWDPWTLTSNMTYIEHTISQGSIVQYAFSSVSAEYHVHIVWDTWWGIEAIRARKAVSLLLPNWYSPDITLSKLEGGWDPTINASKIKLSNDQGTIMCYFEDLNVTRNDIAAAWNDNIMNCTVAYGRESYEHDLWTSKDLVFALLSFRLPTVFTNIDPLFAFIMSALFYVPLAYIVFGLLLAVVRGVSA